MNGRIYRWVEGVTAFRYFQPSALFTGLLLLAVEIAHSDQVMALVGISREIDAACNEIAPSAGYQVDWV